jgi:DNA-binding beta-propeller fold protein YncE
MTRTPARIIATALLVGTVAALPATAVAGQPEAKARGKPTQDVLVVSNNWAGTADVIALKGFKRLARINVIPDEAQRLAEINADPDRKFFFDGIRQLVGEGNNQYVDDGFVSANGRFVYFSRPSFADVVSIDLKTRKIAWRTKIDGNRADHMALSPDGRRLLVSASTARNINVIDTRDGRIVARIPSGDQPHESNYSRDGKTIFHASIGTVFTDTDDPSESDTKGERVFEVIDARTYKVKRKIDMGKKLADFGASGLSSAVRPMAIAPGERFIYFQLSFFHGFVEYDLKRDRPRRLAVLPKSKSSRNLPREDYLLDSAHHGLTINPRGTKFCVAGSMSNYAAIVTRRTLQPERIIPVGKTPYWSTSSEDGRYCFVSVAGEDRVSVISWRKAREVARIKVGDHPQRMRTGTIRAGILSRR